MPIVAPFEKFPFTWYCWKDSMLKQLTLQRIIKAVNFYNWQRNNRKKLVWMLRAKQQKKRTLTTLSRKDINSEHRYIWTVQTLQYFVILQLLSNLLLPYYSPSYIAWFGTECYNRWRPCNIQLLLQTNRFLFQTKS